MKINICLMSCNDNIKYYSFYPFVKKIWEKTLNIKCILIFVGFDLPKLLKPYKDDIIIFKPIENMNTAYIAQNIRLLYPALIKSDNGIIIAIKHHHHQYDFCIYNIYSEVATVTMN